MVPIFDLFIHQGWPAIYKIGVSLLNNFMQTKVLEMDNMMDISHYFRDDMRQNSTFSNNSIHMVIMGAHQINITKEFLIQIREQFYI